MRPAAIPAIVADDEPRSGRTFMGLPSGVPRIARCIADLKQQLGLPVEASA
jgi:hypothetical protein